jgi:hypothetical protein
MANSLIFKASSFLNGKLQYSMKAALKAAKICIPQWEITIFNESRKKLPRAPTSFLLVAA